MKYVCKFDELLHGEVKNEYILSLKKCELIRDTRSATFFFAVSQIPDEKEKARILSALRKLVPKCVERISVSYTRIYFDDEVLRAFLKSFLSKNAASLLCGVDFERVALKEQTLKIPVDENILQFLGDGKLASTLENALSAEYYAYFKVQFSAAEVFQPIEEEEVIVAPVSKRAISVANRAKLVGSEVEGDASYLSDVSAEGTEVVLCGKIKFFTERVRTKKDGSQGAYFTFELEDFTGKIRCVYFPSDSVLEKFRQLKDGDEVICSGDVKRDNRGFNLSYMVRSLSHCELPKDFVPEAPPSKPAASKYQVIFPEPYFRGNQVDLFGGVEDFVAPELREHIYVAFDFETTGLDSETDKIIEIGAAKIVDGKVTESFSALIDPGRPLSETITELTGITNEMLAGKPGIEEVMPDFYKFTRGSVLVGHNIAGFDMKFLQKNAVECGYWFENEILDTLTFARENLTGVPNYKLNTVADYLGVTLESHHRATDDAICSGDIMIEIYNRLARKRQDATAGEVAAAVAPDGSGAE